jgi:hypothetical protein
LPGRRRAAMTEVITAHTAAPGEDRLGDEAEGAGA